MEIPAYILHDFRLDASPKNPISRPDLVPFLAPKPVPFLEPGFGPFRSEIGFFFGTGREPTLGLTRSSSFLGLRFPHVWGSLGRACALL